MVATRVPTVVLAVWQAAAEAELSPWQKLDHQARVTALAGLAAVVILGFALVLLVWLGARVTRRYMATGTVGRRARRGSHPDDWAKKPVDRNDRT